LRSASVCVTRDRLADVGGIGGAQQHDEFVAAGLGERAGAEFAAASAGG